MITLRNAVIEDTHVIQHIATMAWPAAYGNILSPQQMEYMLHKMYNIPALEADMASGVKFIIASGIKEDCGFAGYSIGATQQKTAKLHKLYLLPDEKGKGTGTLLLNDVINNARRQNMLTLQLNVNRYNTALKFYKRFGFTIIRQEDIDVGHGYFMNDYVMELTL